MNAVALKTTELNLMVALETKKSQTINKGARILNLRAIK